jgi:hypothetical protein
MSKLNPSIKYNIGIGFLLSVWIFLFAFIIRPFDDGTLNFNGWLLISSGFSLGAFLSYLALTLFQKSVYQKTLKWNLNFEITSLLFFILLYLLFTYVYYKSSIINGGYTFYEFFSIIFIKTIIILIPIVVLARRYLIKLIPIKEDVLIIKGENKLDILKIKKSELIGISNAQNYVEIFFVQNNELSSKLIRTSLKKIQEELDFLIQIHRSHLINPSHFKSWKNQNTITLTLLELPVSKNYKENLSFI